MLEGVPKIQLSDSTSDNRRRPQPEEGPLSILYEDEAILVVDKPAGIVIHPTYKNTSGTLINAVLWHVRIRADAQPGILTRLDKDTSGVVLIALSPALHASMQRNGAARIKKEYLAVVRGVPEPSSGRISLPLARDSGDRRRVVVTAEGAPSETHYECIASRDGRSVVRCELLTGRTHQIRVHLASQGWPIVGDAVYGLPDPCIARQALHARRITFTHPVTRETLLIESPIPGDLAPLIGETAV